LIERVPLPANGATISARFAAAAIFIEVRIAEKRG
jgi:hypothetical protein